MFWGAGGLFSISDSIKFTKEKVYVTVDFFFDFFVISGSTKPFCLSLSSKPGQLTLCVPARVSLNHTDCFVPRTGLIKICHDMAIADRPERLGIAGNALGEKAANLLH